MYEWSVKVAGGEIRDLVLDARAVIKYGRSSPENQPEPTSATLTLLTSDAAPDVFLQYPSFILNNTQIPSGFVAHWLDHYEGTSTKIELGAPVVIGVTAASGFVSAWENQYRGMLSQTTRFTGSVIAIDYTPGTITLTAATSQEALNRTYANTAGYPAQTDHARLAEIENETGYPIATAGTPKNLIAVEEGKRPTVSYLHDIAVSTGALVYADRGGVLRYRSADAYTPADVTLPSRNTLVDPLTMTLETGRVVNVVTVEYGDRDVNGDRPTVTAQDPASITALGPREAFVFTYLATQADAQTLADSVIAERGVAWEMPNAVVLMADVTEDVVGAIGNLEIGDNVTLPKLLPGSPANTYTAQLLGYTETIARATWTLDLYLSPLNAETPTALGRL